jgi:hypothetical protein
MLQIVQGLKEFMCVKCSNLVIIITPLLCLILFCFVCIEGTVTRVPYTKGLERQKGEQRRIHPRQYFPISSNTVLDWGEPYLCFIWKGLALPSYSGFLWLL